MSVRRSAQPNAVDKDKKDMQGLGNQEPVRAAVEGSRQGREKSRYLPGVKVFL